MFLTRNIFIFVCLTDAAETGETGDGSFPLFSGLFYRLINQSIKNSL